MLDQNLPLGVDHTDHPLGRCLESLVVRSVFLSFLSHEPHIGHGPHGPWIKGSMLLAVINGCLIHPGIGAVRYHCQGVLQLALSIPHLPG